MSNGKKPSGPKAAQGERPHMFLARVEREIVDGETVEVALHLLHPSTRIQIKEGDEFVTLFLKVDPFQEVQPQS